MLAIPAVGADLPLSEIIAAEVRAAAPEAWHRAAHVAAARRPQRVLRFTHLTDTADSSGRCGKRESKKRRRAVD